MGRLGAEGYRAGPGPGGVSAGLRLPLPAGGWHRARRGRRRVCLSSGLGAGAAAVRGAVQSHRGNQVRRPLPLGIHGKTTRSRIAGAHNTFRRSFRSLLHILTLYHQHRVLGLCMCEFLHGSACGRCLVQSLSSRPGPRGPANNQLSITHQPQDGGRKRTQHYSFVPSGRCPWKGASLILDSLSGLNTNMEVKSWAEGGAPLGFFFCDDDSTEAKRKTPTSHSSKVGKTGTEQECIRLVLSREKGFGVKTFLSFQAVWTASPWLC